jgi:hypothetical protein
MDDPPILVIDPGVDKCGLAVLSRSSVLRRAVVATVELVPVIASWVAQHRVELVAVGDRTGSENVRRLVMQSFPSLFIVPVEEEGTTLEARRLYFADHPPRGWRRLIPLSMQLPAEPYDDYAAIAMGRRYLQGRGARKAP